jgi:hypothetical protein
MLILDTIGRRVYTDPVLGLAQGDDKWLVDGKRKSWGGTNGIERVIFEQDHVKFGMEAFPFSFIGDLDLNTGVYDNAQGCLLQCQESKGAAIPH